jgi:DNA-binding MarR family transcriptional regulator
MVAEPKNVSDASILEDLPFYLARVGLSFRRFNEQTLRAVGLKSQAPGLASVVHALREQDDCAVSSLVERTHLPNGTLTGVLDALEHDGCIQRARDSEDRRSWRIRLTAKGHRLGAKLEKRHHLVMEVLGQALSEKEAAEFKRMLGRVTDHMRAHET